MRDARDFLMGGGVTSARFERIGDTVSGKISTEPQVGYQTEMGTRKPLYWDDGTQKEQFLVDLATDLRDPTVDNDDGTRRLYVKGAMQYAIRDAVKAAGADDLQRGGTLTVQYTHDGEKRPGFNAPKQYAAQYIPPASAASGFLGTAAQTFQGMAPAAPPAYAPPASAPLPTGNGNGNGNGGGARPAWALDPVQEAALRNAGIDIAGLLAKRQALAEANLDPNLATP